jgi:ATP-dependent protease ClpP protease subunit
MPVHYFPEEPILDIHRFGLDVYANHIYLVGNEEYVSHEMLEEPGVEYSMASRFIKNMNIIMCQNTDPVLIHMKTCGGEWVEGMAIYDMIKACPNKVTILNYTHARSMSSLIFQAADKRVMMPHSTFMFHEGSMEFSGTPKMFRTVHDEEAKALTAMLDIYVAALKKKGKMCKMQPAKIREWLIKQMDKKEDVFLSAAEAVEYGFADEVFGSDGSYEWKKLLEY